MQALDDYESCRHVLLLCMGFEKFMQNATGSMYVIPLVSINITVGLAETLLFLLCVYRSIYTCCVVFLALFSVQCGSRIIC